MSAYTFQYALAWIMVQILFYLVAENVYGTDWILSVPL